MTTQILGKLIRGEDLGFAEMHGAISSLMEGQWTPSQIGGFLVALRIKGETSEEIAAAVSAMREKASRVHTHRTPLIDTCGTGGDHSNSFNISTAAALVASGAGAAVAKHGNRGMSSLCGSANVLQELGVNVELTPEQVGECVDRCGIGFLFAPRLHLAMKYVVGVRQELGQRTIFNLLGPLTNPAGARRQLIGIYDMSLTLRVAEVLQRLGSEHVLVVAGTDGMDEISLSAPTKVAELKDGNIREFILNPEDLGFGLCEREALKGGDAPVNARMLRDVLEGAKGPRRDVTLLNAAAAIYVAGIAKSLREGVEMARHSIDEGAARSTLENFISFSNSHATP